MRAKNKDDSVFRMLASEMGRCARVIEKINSELEKLARGSLGKRKVKSGGKEYIYSCLRYREGSHVVFEHVSQKRAEELLPELERKKKLQKDLRANRLRLNTIKLILDKR